MPTYDYECTKCGNSFETFQSMSDAPLVKCPTCAKNGLKRLIGGGLGVIFKGSGFYVTDSRNGGKQSAAAGTAESTTATKTSDDSGSSDSSSDGSKSDSSTSSAPAATPQPDKSNSGSKAAT